MALGRAWYGERVVAKNILHTKTNRLVDAFGHSEQVVFNLVMSDSLDMTEHTFPYFYSDW